MTKETNKFEITIEEARKIRLQFRLILLSAMTTIVAGATAMNYLEDLSWVDSFYFSVVSLTTVGYGDITPQTDGGKIFVTFYLIIGIAIIAALLNNILRNVMARRVIKHHSSDNK